MIITGLFWVLFTLTIICVIGIMWGIKTANDEIGAPFVFLLLLTCVLGWFILGLCQPVKDFEVQKTANVLVDKQAIYLTINATVVKTYTDIANYNYLKDKQQAKILGVYSRNMYGLVFDSTNWSLPSVANNTNTNLETSK